MLQTSRAPAPPVEIHATGPVLIFGGPYSNLQALEALQADARRRGFSAEQMICTGDVVAYGADAQGTVDLIRAMGCHVVMGNCEENLASGAHDCGCGFAPGSSCDALSAAWFRHAATTLDKAALDWMAKLPRRLDLLIAGRRLAVIHGGTSKINRFVFASTPAIAKRDELISASSDGIIAGHCGLPFTQVIAGRLWHNAGAIGLPANDGTPRGWFSTLTPSADGLLVAHHALDYDHAQAAERMRGSGLPDAYANALVSGLWPICDVLPVQDIRARGIALAPGACLWPATTPRPARLPRNAPATDLWPAQPLDARPRLRADKFHDAVTTANGEPRASVPFDVLRTLWFNTGTLCNIACRNCYIESAPTNDRLAYLTLDDVRCYLDEISREGFPTREIGLTGGEPFMNPDIFPIMDECLARGFRVLVLTNAMRPMQRFKTQLLQLNAKAGGRLAVRVSLDHFLPARHEDERGAGTFAPAFQGLQWLARNGFSISVAGRTMWGDDLAAERAGYAALFAAHDIAVDTYDPAALVLFPEMDPRIDVPEITKACWGILHKSPHDMMCATSRMVIKRKDETSPAVVACTLLPYDARFELGRTLREAAVDVPLNHPHCAKFCVLGGASCSAG